MNNKEALKFAKEQTHIFGGTMKEFMNFVIPLLEERPQGEWIKREEIFDDEETPRLVWGCKDCGFSLKSIHDKRNYCPNCGAKMEVNNG